jgi:CRP/FNR family cyclic AMP-dependent transcriptional regulator
MFSGFAPICMRTMIPLRLIAISSNVAFIVCGFYGGIYPVLVLHVILLPMNIWRTSEMWRLVRNVTNRLIANVARLEAGDVEVPAAG